MARYVIVFRFPSLLLALAAFAISAQGEEPVAEQPALREPFKSVEELVKYAKGSVVVITAATRDENGRRHLRVSSRRGVVGRSPPTG